jgi:hypothetical protein
VQAQVTIDIRKLTCYHCLADKLTDSRTLGIWLNGYVNGERGRKLIEPLSAGHTDLVTYCQSHTDTLVLDVLVPTNSYLAFVRGMLGYRRFHQKQSANNCNRSPGHDGVATNSIRGRKFENLPACHWPFADAAINANGNQELRTEFEVPRGLPPQMAVLVTKLQHA